MSEPTLLCVDDERGILNSLRRLLRKEDYRILTAGSGPEALAVLEDEPVQVVLSDYRMPGMTGTALLGEVRHRHPDTVRVVLSGFADAHMIVASINEGEVYRFLSKPWNDDELKATIRQCFEHYHLRLDNERLLRQVHLQNDVLRQMNDDLERTVTARTRSLQLSQEVLEKLPVPVFGISSDGMVVLVNAATAAVLPDDVPVPLGLPMEMALPPEMTEAVRRCLTTREPLTLTPSNAFGGAYRASLRPLYSGQETRGCLLALEATAAVGDLMAAGGLPDV